MNGWVAHKEGAKRSPVDRGQNNPMRQRQDEGYGKTFPPSVNLASIQAILAIDGVCGRAINNRIPNRVPQAHIEVLATINVATVGVLVIWMCTPTHPACLCNCTRKGKSQKPENSPARRNKQSVNAEHLMARFDHKDR